MTKQKKIVLDIIEQSHNHPTAEEVFFEAKKQMPNIALGTVYRNLNALSEEGAIRRITLAGTPDRFDTNVSKHDHLVCDRCGRLKDVRLKGIRETIEELTGEDLLSYELNVYYVCEDCKKREVMK